MGLGSEIRDPEKIYFGSRIRIRNTAFKFKTKFFPYTDNFCFMIRRRRKRNI
jgi:hypothetical protein